MGAGAQALTRRGWGVTARPLRAESMAAGPDGSIQYWRDGDGTHHVPKRVLDQVILDL